MLGEAKVGELPDFAHGRGAVEDVGGLKIAVNDAILVEDRQPGACLEQHVLGEGEALLVGARHTALNLVLQRAVAELHHEAEAGLSVEVGHERPLKVHDNVGLDEATHDGDFTEELIDFSLVREHGLYRDRAAKFDVLALKDLPKAPLSKVAPTKVKVSGRNGKWRTCRR